MRFFSFLLVAFLGLTVSFAHAQTRINPDNVQIVRDKWGVPHIYGKTDADAAYGLAWATAEDQFYDMQLNLYNGLGRLGEVKGKEGAILDFLVSFASLDTLVEKRYDTDFSPEYKKVVEAYCQGVNDYAAKHPKEVLLKNAFPITPKQYILSCTVAPTLMAGVGMTLKYLKEGNFREAVMVNEGGSNAMAVAAQRSAENKTFLLINSHQPTEGRFAWYEAHVKSDEGMNILGGLFPGGPCIFVGTNEHLGWAHTNNYSNWGDAYELTINPDNKKQYRFDGKWLNFTQRVAKVKAKVGFLKIPVKKTIYSTVHGPVIDGKDGKLFALRFPSFHDLRATEQWWRMNKARNLKEFKDALRMEALPLFNVVYGDNKGNILYRSEGKYPKRDPKLDWLGPLPGESAAHVWTELMPFEAKPEVENPECGYVYNANNTPLHCTGESCNFNRDFVGLQKFEYNRGEQFGAMLKAIEGKITWEDFMRIKHNKAYHPNGTYKKAFAILFTLDEKKYPDIADAIESFRRWNLSGEADNKEAALAMVTHYEIGKATKMDLAIRTIIGKPVEEAVAVDAIRKAKAFLLKHHKTINPPMGQVLRHTRGNVNLPLGGQIEVPVARHVKPNDDIPGTYRANGGDCYYMYVKYNPAGGLPEITTINAYGASAKAGSPHFTDQMEMFANEQTKPMTLDFEAVKKDAQKVYSPK